MHRCCLFPSVVCQLDRYKFTTVVPEEWRLLASEFQHGDCTFVKAPSTETAHCGVCGPLFPFPRPARRLQFSAVLRPTANPHPHLEHPSDPALLQLLLLGCWLRKLKAITTGMYPPAERHSLVLGSIFLSPPLLPTRSHERLEDEVFGRSTDFLQAAIKKRVVDVNRTTESRLAYSGFKPSLHARVLRPASNNADVTIIGFGCKAEGGGCDGLF
jgi:hypothetical protein